MKPYYILILIIFFLSSSCKSDKKDAIDEPIPTIIEDTIAKKPVDTIPQIIEDTIPIVEEVKEIKAPKKGKEITKDAYVDIATKKVIEMREMYGRGRGGRQGGRRR